MNRKGSPLTMYYEIFLGLRYLRAKRKQAFISVITVISILGVMVGVMSLVVVLSVMNGYRADLMSKILGVNAHVLILSYGGPFENYREISSRVKKMEGVLAASPFIYAQVMLNHAGNVSGAVLRAIDSTDQDQLKYLGPMIKSGSLSSLASKSDGYPTIIVGRELARQLGVHPGLTLTVVAPEGKVTPLGRAPESRQFKVVGLFDSGMYEYDASMVWVDLKEAQRLLGMGDKVTGVEVRVADVYSADKLGESIQKALGYPFWTKDWMRMNRNLFAALKLEKITMFVILTMIVLVGALNIINTLVMAVMEKRKEVAILRAMGAKAKSVMAIFMIQGVVVGILGTVAGLASGLLICHLLAKYKFISLPADVYYISTLPVQVQWADVVFVAVAAVLISLLATIYPSFRASKVNPVEALRYE